MSFSPPRFTFSTSSSSASIRTPSSSRGSDGDSNAPGQVSPSAPRSLPITSPPPIFTFQGLNLESPSDGASYSSRSGRERSSLTPTRSLSTYADQHNASPSPRPIRATSSQGSRDQTKTISPPSSLFSNHNTREPIARSEASEIDIEQVKVPGAFPASRYGSENRTPASAKSPSTIRRELLPSAPIYNGRLQDGLKDVKSMLASLADVMRVSELAQDQSSSLNSHLRQTEKASKFNCPETRTVGIIGDSGVAACTCVVTEFRAIDDNHSGPFSIEAEFMTTQEMRELIEELLVNFRQFYVASAYHELEGPDQQDCRSSADRAWETFQSLFKGQPSLTIKFLSDDTTNAYPRILEQLERWAYIGLARRPGGPDALEHSVIAGDLKECADCLDFLAADSKEDNTPALWPFVKLIRSVRHYKPERKLLLMLIRVYLDSPILRTGLVLADMPGLGDLNFARVRATERYLKHNCDEVFIAANISRACSDESVHDIIRRCGHNQPRRIICTRSDVFPPCVCGALHSNIYFQEVSAKEAAREEKSIRLHIERMESGLKKVRDDLEEAEDNRRGADESDRAGFALRESQLRLRRRKRDGISVSALHLKSRIGTDQSTRLDRFLIKKRNNLISQALTGKYEGIRVFCVSNTLYAKHRKGRHPQAEAYVNLAGIRELRRYCQLVPAEAQMRAARAFLEHEVPALLGSLRQWMLSGADHVTAEKAATLRSCLENAERVLHRVCSELQIHKAHQSTSK
ncbi:hypothetical protein N7492_006818 [Penicillium capsulatum]|uniref:Uncharacterized protein n=1 Tax=Penicillium capsulatum TaxID=69766 RepID=A0A9W9I0V7_9EURO|nr:hypothetical protein N7492_006818 [Penicillium capsulatum]